MRSQRRFQWSRAIITSLHPQSENRNSLFRRLHVEALEDRRMLAVITVDSPLDNFDPASPTTDGLVTLREAVRAANVDEAVGDAPAGSGADTIEFDFGHDGPETILLTHGELVITSDMTINGPGADLLTIDASGSDPTPDVDNGDGSRVFNIDDRTDSHVDVAIYGLTLTGGADIARGGAIRNFESLTIARNAIRGNSASNAGGGVFTHDGNLTIIDSTINSNSAEFGGGVRSMSGNLTVTRSTISENSATATASARSRGGGIHQSDGELHISYSTITANHATVTEQSQVSEGGGVLSVRQDAITISHSIIAGNGADTGPDLHLTSPPIVVDFSLIGGYQWFSHH